MSRSDRCLEARLREGGHIPAFFEGADPPVNLAIQLRQRGEERHYVFVCRCTSAAIAPTVPSLSEVRHVERFADRHRRCA